MENGFYSLCFEYNKSSVNYKNSIRMEHNILNIITCVITAAIIGNQIEKYCCKVYLIKERMKDS